MKKAYSCCLLVLSCVLILNGLALAGSSKPRISKKNLRLKLAWTEQVRDFWKDLYLKENGRADSLAAALELATSKTFQEEQTQQVVAQSSKQDTRLVGTEKFLPTKDIQQCCGRYIGGKTSGGYQCLDWAKGQYQQDDGFQVKSCAYKDEQVARRRGLQTIHISYQKNGQELTKTFSAMYFFKE